MRIVQSRRDFLASMSAAGAAGILCARSSLADEGPPETTTLRLKRSRTICVAPEQIADDLLRAEGFTDIHYLQVSANPGDAVALARGELDFAKTPLWDIGGRRRVEEGDRLDQTYWAQPVGGRNARVGREGNARAHR
jgi:hypothetical protein